MTKINNQFPSLSSIEFVDDLSPETAAAISGGIQVYTGGNFTGK